MHAVAKTAQAKTALIINSKRKKPRALLGYAWLENNFFSFRYIPLATSIVLLLTCAFVILGVTTIETVLSQLITYFFIVLMQVFLLTMFSLYVFNVSYLYM